MGLGIQEMFFILATIALLFGPGAVIVWWFMTQQRASSGSAAPTAPPVDSALQAARERFARGEITAEELEAIKRVLDE